MKLSQTIFLGLAMVFAGSCSKKDNDESTAPDQAAIEVSAINPASGPYSTVVTITGSGFNTTASQNVVKFNGKTAVVQSATATQIIAVVPEAAGTGNVSVSWGSRSATGPVFDFTYTITVSTFCGSGFAGFLNGGPAVSQFNYPYDLSFDSNGDLYVADLGNNMIRKISTAGLSSTFAGTGIEGSTDGNGTFAQFYGPSGIDIDSSGVVYVADEHNARLRRITPAGVVSTIAGTSEGYMDGNGNAAQFNYPTDIKLDANGNLFVTDQVNHRIRKVSPSAVVSTFAGNSTAGLIDGNGINASFDGPVGMAMDGSQNLIVADYANHTIRKVNSNGDVTTLAGTGTAGYVDGPVASAQFDYPWGVAVAGNGNIYVADYNNNKIRLITPSGMVSTIAGSTYGFTNGNGAAAKFANPTAVAVDESGNLYVSDSGNNVIRKITIQ